jgi:hypothetical protein
VADGAPDVKDGAALLAAGKLVLAGVIAGARAGPAAPLTGREPPQPSSATSATSATPTRPARRL